MTYMKDSFEKWLSRQKSVNGKSYSKETVLNYVKALKSYSAKLQDISLTETDLFNIDNSKDFELTTELIKNSDNYSTINDTYHRIFSSALNVYQKFLDDNSNSKSDNTDNFIQWLKNSKDNYSDNTIKRYIYALTNAEDWFDINLETPILSIIDYQELLTIQNRIKQLSNYTQINREHSHGDYSAAMTKYTEYLKDLAMNSSIWWPSLNEYDPGITKDQWLKLLNNPEIIGPVWGGALAMFYDQGGAATCSELADIYGKNPSGIAGNCTHLAMQIHKVTHCPLITEDEKTRYWPILFVGKEQEKGGKGNWIWKLRTELYNAIAESDIMKYLPEKVKNAWLLTWNLNSYDWKDYDEKRASVLQGDSCLMTWACKSKKVQVGDRVYMEILGAGEKNGIIASGYVTNPGFEDEHWDGEKAAEGKTVNKIEFNLDCMLDYKNENILKQSDLKVLFPNQQWSPMGTGISIRNEYKESLEEEWKKFASGKTLVEETPVREMTMSSKDTIEYIKTFIASKGFSYNSGLIENFYLSLKSKPFVILAGTSGTGKTRLVRLFAEAIQAKYKMVAVRPDWSDSSDLFGYVDLNGNFIAGEILDFISEAKKNIDVPYILCLDEMNLARVEYYLSDFLSIIETRDLRNDHIVSDPLVSAEKYGHDEDAYRRYGEIDFPENLYLVGTVNMDETTFPFSKKVLDRANTIEFNYVDLNTDVEIDEDKEPLCLPNTFLKTKYLLLAQCKDDPEFVKEISSELQRMNLILQKANAHVGYRVRDEIVFYMLNNKETELLPRDEAFDNEIMQKVLPRIQGELLIGKRNAMRII